MHLQVLRRTTPRLLVYSLLCVVGTASVFGQDQQTPTSPTTAPTTTVAPSTPVPDPGAITGAVAPHTVSAAATVPAANASDRLALKIETVPPLDVKMPTSSGWSAKDVLPPTVTLVGTILTIGVAIYTLRTNARNTQESLRHTAESVRNSRESMIQEVNEAEMKELERKLDGFYGPYLHLSETNATLAHELKARQNQLGKNFRTLLALLDPEEKAALSENDKAIIAEIVSIDGALQELIEEKAGLLDDEVQRYLWRADAHFRIIRLAHEGKLSGEPNRFVHYVYPLAVDNVLREEVKRLRARHEKLRRAPTTEHEPIARLVIPKEKAFELLVWPPPKPDAKPAAPP